MNKSLRLTLFLFLFGVSAAHAQSIAERLRAHVSYLAADSMHGRAPGSADEQKAAAYISSYLRDSCRAQITRQRFGFRIDSLHAIDTTANIIGLIDNHARETIILCAHYDHLGYGSGRSAEIIAPRGIHPGADDNASGVALMLELAHWVHEQHIRSCNFVFLATSAHELGLYGATHFVMSGWSDSMRVSAVFNFDMVGRLHPALSTLRVSTSDTSASRHGIIASHSRTIQLRYDDVVNDYTVFKEHGFHAYSFTTGIHDDYHRHSDTEHKINYSGMVTIFEFMRGVINDWQ